MKNSFRKTLAYLMATTVVFSNFSGKTVQAIETIISKNSSKIIIKASDYNLDPTGEKDNAKALVTMFDDVREKSKEGKHITLKFDKGIYQVHKENSPVREIHTSNTDSVRFPNKSIGILVENQNNLTIDGNGSEFIINGDMMALAIIGSENIDVKNLHIDYQIPTTSEMTVLEYDKENKTIDYFIPEYLNYEIQDNNILWKSEQKSDGGYYWTERNGHRNYGVSVKYPTELMGRTYYSGTDPFTNASLIEKIDDSRVRITYRSNPAFEVVKGMNFQLVSNSERPTSGGFVWESKDVNIINTKISYMHGFGFLVQMAENVTFDGVRMETDIETGRNTSSFADGIHISGAKGKIEIKNSFFNNTHDDPINIHGTFTRVEEKIDDHKLRLKYIHAQQGGFPQYHKGDKVVFYSRNTLESSDAEREYTVKSVEGPNRDSLKEMIVEFEEELPDYLTEKIGSEPKYVAENSTYTPELYIKNNEFKNVFTRMILATSRKKIVIEDNYFEAPSMATLFFSNDSNEWYESGPIRNLEIRNNIFKIRSLGRTWWKYAPAIYFHPVTKGGGLPSEDNPIHKNIMIENNKFYLESDGALRAESVENLTFRNNEVYRLDPSVNLKIEGNNKLYVGDSSNLQLTYDGNVVSGPTSLPGGPEGNEPGTVANVLEFKNSKNVVVENNHYDDGLRKNVLIDGMNRENLKLKDNLKVINKGQKIDPSRAVSDIRYASTNPEVVSIDSNGNITANKEGKAEVFAYYIWNNTIIESNRKEITVLNNDNQVEDKLNFVQEVISINDDNGVSFEFNTDINKNDVQYTIHDTDIVKIKDGKFYGLKTGLARVTAKYGSTEKTVFVIVNKKEDHKILNPRIKIENKDGNSSISENEIKIVRKEGNDLWQGSNTLNNLVTIDLGNVDKNNFTGIVTMDGLPKRIASNNWDSAYFLLMKENENGTVDRDNYISIGKRAHADGIAGVHEVSAKGNEFATSNADENDVVKATFAIEKKDNNVNLYYIINGVKKLAHTADISGFGDKLKFGVATWNARQDNKELTVTDIKVAEGTVENVLNTTSLPIMVNDESRFEISNLNHSIDDKGNVTVQYDSGVEGNTNLIVVAPGNNTYLVKGNSFKATRNGQYKVFVVSKSTSGKYSNILEAKFEYTESAKNGVYINGIKVATGDTLIIPEKLTKLDVMNYDINKKSVLDVVNKNELTVDGKTIKLKKIASNSVKIESINADGYGSFDLSNKDSFINTDKKNDSITFNVKLSEETDKLLAKNHDHQINYEVVQNGRDAKVTVPVYNGVVSVSFEALAKDGITKDVHDVHVMRYAKIEKGFDKIDVIPVGIVDNSITVSEGKIDLENKTNTILISPKAKDTNASITIFRRNKNGVSELVNGEEVIVENDDEIILRIVHENKRTMEFKTFRVENSEEVKIDITSLLDLIKQAEDIDLSNKTEESKDIFLSVLEEVKSKVEEGIKSEEQLKELKEKLKVAIDGLKDREEEPENPEKPENPEMPENPQNPETPENPENPQDPDDKDDQNSDDQDQQDKDEEVDDNKEELPQTGDNKSILMIVCLLLILATGTTLIVSRRKHNS